MGGGGGEQTVGYKYYLGVHMVASMGPVDGCVGIKVDNKVAWSGFNTGSSQIVINQPDLFGGDSSEGGVSGAIDFSPGAPSQGTNDYLVANLGDPLVPTFRGVASFVLRQCYMGNNPYLKAWSFRMQRVHTRQDGTIAQWYNDKAAISLATEEAPANGFDISIWRYILEAKTSTSDYSAENFDDSSWSTGTLPFADGGFGGANSGATGHGFRTPPSVVIDTGLTLWLRRQYDVSQTQDVLFDCYCDDTVEAWVNGVKVVTNTSAGEKEVTHTIPAANFRIGSNTIAIRTIDTGGPGSGDRAYFDLKLPVLDNTIDMNPAHIIRECLTDPDWGMGYSEEDMDDDAFTACADRLFTEALGMSLMWDTQTDIQDFITTILTHIDAVLFVDRTTGKFVLKLIRDDYVVADILDLTEDDIDYVQDFHRAQFGELTTAVTVQYWDSASNVQGTVTVQDIALETMQDATIATTVQYPGFSNGITATIIAQRDLRTLSSQLATGTVYAGRKAKVLQMGDVFKMTWPDYELEDTVMRVMGVGYGDGASNRIRLTVTEDVFTTDTTTFVAPPAPPAWVDPSGPPIAATNEFAFEVPYLELVQQQTQNTVDSSLITDPLLGIVGVAVGRPTQGSINAGIWTDAGAGYTQNATADFCPTATLGSDTDLMQETFPISAGDELDLVTLGTWVQIDSEIMEITALSDTSISVHRSCLDTVPAKHLSGAKLYFWDAFPSADPTQYDSGETVNVKLTPKTGSGTLDISKATLMSVTLANRAIRPYPPGNLKINAQYFPAQVEGDMVLTWAHRDRTQQTGGDLVSFKDASIGPETGTTYTLKVYNGANSLVRTVSGITAATTTYTGTQETTDGGPFSAFRFTLASERDGYESWQIYDVSLTRPAPIPVVGVFLPSASPLEANPHIVRWNNSAFVVGIEGTVDGNDTIGYYKIPDTIGIPVYLGTAYQVRDDGAGHNFTRPYNGTGLEMIFARGLPISAGGINTKLSIFYSRRTSDLTPNRRWLITYDDSDGEMTLVDTVDAINTDIVAMIELADGSAIYAWSIDTTANLPYKFWKSVDGGNVWSYQGACTNLVTEAGGVSLVPAAYVFQIGSTFLMIGAGNNKTSTDGLVWTDVATVAAGAFAYDGTAIVGVGREVPTLAYDSTVLADGPLNFIGWTGSNAGVNFYGNRVLDGNIYVLRIVPNGVGITGWGLSPGPGLTVAEGINQAGGLGFSGQGNVSIRTVVGSYLELRNSSNGAINWLQGTTDFTIECWVKVTTGTDQPAAHSEVVLFSQCCAGSPQFQNVLLTYKPVDNVLRFRTIRQTASNTYVADVDISITTAFNIINTPDFTSTHLVVTRGASGKVRVYVNGADIGGQASGTTTNLTVTGSNQLGCVWGNTNSQINCISGASTPTFGILFDALCLYSKELTSAQVANHYDVARADGLTHNVIYRSTDVGSTWTKVRDVLMQDDVNSTGSGFYIAWSNVVKFGTGFAVYGTDPGTGAFPHFLHSTDHGVTWDSTNTKLITSDGTDNAAPIQVHSNGTTIFGTLTTRVVSGVRYPQFAYTTDGFTWTDMSTAFPPGSSGFNLIVLDDAGDPRFGESGEIRITE